MRQQIHENHARLHSQNTDKADHSKCTTITSDLPLLQRLSYYGIVHLKNEKWVIRQEAGEIFGPDIYILWNETKRLSLDIYLTIIYNAILANQRLWPDSRQLFTSFGPHFMFSTYDLEYQRSDTEERDRENTPQQSWHSDFFYMTKTRCWRDKNRLLV